MDMGNCMKAIPITYQGIQFRSKLECRHYNFMKKIGWNIEYEPEVKDVYGYQPDFELFSEIEANEDGFILGGCSHSAKRYFKLSLIFLFINFDYKKKVKQLQILL